MELSNVKAILFDFDGVIMNSVSFYRQAWLGFFKNNNYPINPEDFENEKYFTKSVKQVCEVVDQKYGITLEMNQIFQEMAEIERTLMAEGLEYDPSLIPLLEYCKASGIKLAIGSSTWKSRIVWVMEKMNITKYFDAIVSSDDVTHHKPDPEVWLKGAELLSVPIEECLVIEDGLPGLTGAKECGAGGIYYHRFCKPSEECEKMATRSVGSFSELIR